MNLEEIRSTNPVQAINQIISQGVFSCSISSIFDPQKEEFVDECSNYEKAALILRNQLNEEFTEIGENLNVTADDFPEINENLHDLNGLAKFYDDFFWLSIRMRLKDKLVNEIGVRADWKIVNILSVDSDEEGHDCENCDAQGLCLMFNLKASMC